MDTVKQYLSYLHLPIEEPSYNYLERICHAHLNTFPFENISKLVLFRDHQFGNFAIPSFQEFIANHTQHNFGGTCYTLNSNLLLLLKELGFDCYHIMLGNEHIGIIVQIEGERYYVDCGAAAPFFKPVPFETDDQNSSHFGNDEVRILPIDRASHHYKYERFTNGKQSGKTWYFHSRERVTIADFLQVIEKSNQANAPFMTILRCQLYQTAKQRSVSLVNNKFGIRYSSGETVVTTLSSVEEISNVLKLEFQLPKLPVKEAIDVLEALNIDIFSDKTN